MTYTQVLVYYILSLMAVVQSKISYPHFTERKTGVWSVDSIWVPQYYSQEDGPDLPSHVCAFTLTRSGGYVMLLSLI